MSCQYSSSSSRHQAVEPLPRHLPRRHVVHQARELVGERERGGRASWRPAAARRAARLEPLGPLQDQLREQHAALEPAQRRRQVERRPRRSRLRRRRARPRRCRRSARCAAGSRHRSRAHRGRRRAPAGRRAASAGRASPSRAPADRRSPGSPRSARRRCSASISVGRNGAEAGIVKTRGASCTVMPARRRGIQYTQVGD